MRFCGTCGLCYKLIKLFVLTFQWTHAKEKIIPQLVWSYMLRNQDLVSALVIVYISRALQLATQTGSRFLHRKPKSDYNLSLLLLINRITVHFYVTCVIAYSAHFGERKHCARIICIRRKCKENILVHTASCVRRCQAAKLRTVHIA